MYIFIFDDGKIKHSDIVTDDEKDDCDCGVMEMIDISDPSDPQYYRNGGWYELDKVDTEVGVTA